MATGWYIVPYKRVESGMFSSLPTRYCEMDDYTHDIIYVYGGAWTESEVLGDRAIVKVRTRQAILDVLDNRFTRLPKDRLDDPLSDLSPSVINHMRDWALDCGYSLDEIHEAFAGGLENYTLRDYLHFLAQRRLKPRWDREADEIILDGPVQGCRSVESVDEEVTE